MTNLHLMLPLKVSASFVHPCDSLRLGGDEPVSEEVKRQALAAC